jgi:hypothetical protein
LEIDEAQFSNAQPNGDVNRGKTRDPSEDFEEIEDKRRRVAFQTESEGKSNVGETDGNIPWFVSESSKRESNWKLLPEKSGHFSDLLKKLENREGVLLRNIESDFYWRFYR